MKNSNKRRKNPVPPFLLVSILIHIGLFALLAYNNIKNEALKEAARKNKENYIEITDIPIPEENQTEPPEEIKRLANRSQKVEKESTPDEFTKLAKQKKIITPIAKPKPEPKAVAPEKKTETVKKEKEPEKTEPKQIKNKDYNVKEDILRKNKLASLPKQKFEKFKDPSEQVNDKSSAQRPNIAAQNPYDFDYDYNTEENRVGSRSTKKEAVVSLNTTEYKYTSYFSKLREKIYQVWTYPDESRRKGEYGDLRIIFTIRNDGYLEEVRILRSSGFKNLDNEVLRTINVAAPFYPFPKSWEEEKIKIPAVFNYELRSIF